MSATGLRIGLVYDALYPYVTGGAEKRYHELAMRLAERNEVHELTWQFWDGPADTVRDGIHLHGVGRPPALYGADGKRTVREALAFSVRLLPVLLRQRWDVVDCSATPYLPLYAAWLGTRLTRTPLVATWHEFWGEHWSEYLPGRPIVARVARLLEAGARPLADRRVAVSPFTARRMRAASAADSGTLDHDPVVVGNGVDVDRFADGPRDPDQWDVVHLGRLIDEKRVDLLLRAIAELAPELPGLRVAIAGEGPERPALEGTARELGVAAQVEFLGAVDDDRVPRLLRAARTLVLASEREGYGIAVVEAQAAGAVPVVASGPHTAAPDLVRHGVDGLVVAPRPEALAAALRSLLSDEPQRALLAAAARATARDRDWRVCVAEIERVYAGVVRNRDKAAEPRKAIAADGWLPARERIEP